MRAFFIFDPGQEPHRVNAVIESWTRKGHQAASLFLPDLWGELEPQGEEAIQEALQERAEETQIGIILIDAKTSEHGWVRSAVKVMSQKRRAMIAIHVHKIPDPAGNIGPIGSSHFGLLEEGLFFFQIYPIYRWMIDDGPSHVEEWAQEALRRAEEKKRST